MAGLPAAVSASIGFIDYAADDHRAKPIGLSPRAYSNTTDSIQVELWSLVIRYDSFPDLIANVLSKALSLCVCDTEQLNARKLQSPK